MEKNNRLLNFPISFFSVILGLAGFTIAWQKMENILWGKIIFSSYILFFTSIIFIVISFFYLLKIIKFYDKVWEEFHNPIKLSFFPTFSISLILLAIGFLDSFS
jgi:tellurite resistance protein